MQHRTRALQPGTLSPCWYSKLSLAGKGRSPVVLVSVRHGAGQELVRSSHPCYYKWDPWTSSIAIIWECAGNAESQAQMQTCWIRLYLNNIPKRGAGGTSKFDRCYSTTNTNKEMKQKHIFTLESNSLMMCWLHAKSHAIITCSTITLRDTLVTWPKWTLPSKHQVQWNDERSQITDAQRTPCVTWKVHGKLVFFCFVSEILTYLRS